MGRRYSDEIEQLSSTVRWACAFDLKPWLSRVRKLRGKNLIVVASGGSISVASLLANLHSNLCARLAVVMTPLEFLSSATETDAAVWFISASGANQDILNAWTAAVDRELRDLVVLCGNPESALATQAKGRALANVCFDMPAGRDGFLATNSLIAFCCLCLRLYDEDIPAVDLDRLPTIEPPGLERRSLIVLYGGWLKAAALDVESRFVEVALSAIALADFRNFAHGRHYWLAKHPHDTAVLALVSPAFEALAVDTLAQVPTEIPCTTWRFASDGPQAAFEAILASLLLAGKAAQAKGYDAGRPGVPPFGERLYHLPTTIRPTPPYESMPAVARKLRASTQRDDQAVQGLLAAEAEFRGRLQGARLAGAVFDYDGTLVATPDRFGPLDAAMSAALTTLLKQGLRVGIATGRGRSCCPHLRAAIPARFWPEILVGYYNGGILRSLAESCDGLGEGEPDERIKRSHELLTNLRELKGADVTLKETQLTIEHAGFREHGLWLTVRQALDAADLDDLKVTHSSHSVDVLPREVSKVAVVEQLAQLAGVDGTSILKVGDRGAWPGNDWELLSAPHGLSVDEISPDPVSCWNLLPRGVTGHHGTIWYLNRIVDRHLIFP